jgi:uncharacterized protein (DUF433 family)
MKSARNIKRASGSGASPDSIRRYTPCVVYSAEQACRLANISEYQLRHWDNKRIFRPEYVSKGRGPFNRLYSFRDIVGLRTLNALRSRYGISVSKLREFGEWLHGRYESPWASIRFYISGNALYCIDPVDGSTICLSRPTGQRPLGSMIAMKAVISSVSQALKAMRTRKRSDLGKLTRNRYVASNACLIAGTRVRTSVMWDYQQAGYSIDAILTEFPRLTPRDVACAIDYERQRRAS